MGRVPRPGMQSGLIGALIFPAASRGLPSFCISLWWSAHVMQVIELPVSGQTSEGTL